MRCDPVRVSPLAVSARGLASGVLAVLLLMLPDEKMARAITPPPNFSCSFSVSTIDFGVVNPLSGLAPTTFGSVRIRCRRGTRFGWVTVCPNIEYGSGNPSAWNPRQMANSANFSQKLHYQLYHSGSNAIWGSFYWAHPARPPVLHYRLNSAGAGSWTMNIDARIMTGQTGVVPGIYTSSFSGKDVRFAYQAGYASSCYFPDGVESPSFQVRATVQKYCEVSATDLDFGTAGVLHSNVDANGIISVRCTNGTPYRVGLNGGLAGAASPDQRRMSQGAYSIRYGIYRDSNRTQGWGDQPGNSASGTGNGNVQQYAAYGRVFAQPTPPAGTYTDTIVVTVTY